MCFRDGRSWELPLGCDHVAVTRRRSSARLTLYLAPPTEAKARRCYENNRLTLSARSCMLPIASVVAQMNYSKLLLFKIVILSVLILSNWYIGFSPPCSADPEL